MFEKFSEKAINVVMEAQEIAHLNNAPCVRSEHLLLALVKEAKGISLKIFRNYNIDFETLKKELFPDGSRQICDKADRDVHDSVSFSENARILLNRTLEFASSSGQFTVLYEHLFLALISEDSFNHKSHQILVKLGFDMEKSRQLLEKLVQKKNKRLYHPEVEDMKSEVSSDVNSIYDDSKETAKVFDRAVSKLSTSHYEILGTEQIISSILEDKDSDLAKTLAQYGITFEVFEEKLSNIKNRHSEYAEKQIIFTPNAFRAINSALETAKELGSSVVLPEHIILGILKTKKGIAYDILTDLHINNDDLAHSIIKPIEKQMPETLTILRLAKQEARRLGRNVVGTEMFLLGIIGEATGIGATVLTELEITIRDARTVVERLIGFGDEYFDKEIIFTERAKRVLEVAWQFAKIENKEKIESEHILLAITTEPTSLAMKALEMLGVDSMEIKEGIKKHKC